MDVKKTIVKEVVEIDVEQLSTNLSKVMPKEGQFVMIWIYDGKVWSQVLRWIGEDLMVVPMNEWVYQGEWDRSTADRDTDFGLHSSADVYFIQ